MFTAIAFVVWRAGWAPALGHGDRRLGRGRLRLPRRPQLLRRPDLQRARRLRRVPARDASRSSCSAKRCARAQRELEERQRELSTTNLALENKIEAQSLLAAIVASSEDAIISKTLDGIITSWNKGAERLFGWTRRRGDRPVDSPDRAAGAARRRSATSSTACAAASASNTSTSSACARTARACNVSVTMSPVYDRHGHIIGASKTARDITDAQGVGSQPDAQRRGAAPAGRHPRRHARAARIPAMVMREIVTRVGLHFDVTRCAYGEVDADQHELHDRARLHEGRADRGRPLPARRLRPAAGRRAEGRTHGRSIDDVAHRSAHRHAEGARDLRGDADRARWSCVPLVRGGRLVGGPGDVPTAQPRAWTSDEARPARAGRRAHAVCGRERPRRGGAARESRRAAAGDAHRAAWARGRATWCSTRCGGAPSSPSSSACRPTTPTTIAARLFGAGSGRRIASGCRQVIEEALDDARRTTRSNSSSSTRATGEWRWMEARGTRRIRRRRQADDAVRTRRSTSPSAGAPSRRCRKRIAARTNSWRRSRTSCATRSRRSARACTSCASSDDPAQRSTALEIMERQVAPDGAAGRRPARRRAHHDRQGGVCAASRSISPPRSATPSKPASRCSARPGSRSR